MHDVRSDVGDLRERMARLEGLFEGFTGRARGRAFGLGACAVEVSRQRNFQRDRQVALAACRTSASRYSLKVREQRHDHRHPDHQERQRHHQHRRLDRLQTAQQQQCKR